MRLVWSSSLDCRTTAEAAVDESVLISGQLEEERLLSAEQAETFSRQIQSLKGTSRLQRPHKCFPAVERRCLSPPSRSAEQRPGAGGEPAGEEEKGAAPVSGGGAAAAALG